MADKAPENPKLEIKLQQMAVKDLKPSTYNPRKIHPNKFKALKKSIEKYGILDPLVVNKRTGNTIVGGHQRYRAANELGIETVPVNLIDVDEAQEKLLNLGLNNIKGENDKPKLETLIRDLLSLKIDDIELSGFDMQEINALAGLGDEEEVDDPEYPIAPFFSEKYNYVVVFTKNEVDWTYLRNALGVETKKSYKSTATGTCHVVTFEEFQDKWNNR